jgi:hypothetical protein
MKYFFKLEQHEKTVHGTTDLNLTVPDHILDPSLFAPFNFSGGGIGGQKSH